MRTESETALTPFEIELNALRAAYSQLMGIEGYAAAVAADLRISLSRRRFVLYPGYLISGDGQKHYVSSALLALLYGVSMRYCTIYPTGDDSTSEVLRRIWRARPSDIELRPRPDGNYQLPDTL